MKRDYDVDDWETIDEYVHFLEENEYVFFTDKPEVFPPLELRWESPSIITNAIIDTDDGFIHDYKDYATKLDELRCQALELRFFSCIRLERLESILSMFSTSGLRTIQIILKYDSTFSAESLRQLVNRNLRVNYIILFSVPQFSDLIFEELTNIILTSEDITSEAHCGAISPNNFSSNIPMYMESQFYNNCLNRKISIDRNGFVKNCPSMDVDFGHVSSVKLSEVIESIGFKEMWAIRKDQISVCKDCEFRYLCTDCRAYIENPMDPYSKPLKCRYNPYTAQWNM